MRQNLSVYLRAIQEAGVSIQVTDRGHPVAVLAPLKVGADDYDALEAAGRLRPAQAAWSSLPAPIGPVTTAGTDALAALREDRF